MSCRTFDLAVRQDIGKESGSGLLICPSALRINAQSLDVEVIRTEQRCLVGAVALEGKTLIHAPAAAIERFVRTVGVAVFTDALHGVEDILSLLVVRPDVRHAATPLTPRG